MSADKDLGVAVAPTHGSDEIPQERKASVAKITKTSSIIMVLVSGLALFSDGYNAQIIGYMNPLFVQLYPDGFSSTIKTRLSNSYLIGEIIGMLFFGFVIDKIGRRTGILFVMYSHSNSRRLPR